MKRITPYPANIIFNEICRYYGINEVFIKDCYNQRHRGYHDFTHILNLIDKINQMPQYIPCNNVNGGEKYVRRFFDLMVIAAIYHDIVYDPTDTEGQNEIKSYEVFEADFNDEKFWEMGDYKFKDGEKEFIKRMILNTKTHIHHGDYCFKKEPSVFLVPDGSVFTNQAMSYFLYCDLCVLAEGSYAELIHYERGIFREYQFVNYKTYQVKRLEIIQHYKELLRKVYLVDNPNINKLIDYVISFEPKIGFYAGSFNPFHRGHLDILNQAEKVFDKVVIARGINPDKKGVSPCPMPDFVKYYEYKQYKGMISDAIKDIGDNVFIVRGLRDEDDFKAERKMNRWMEELYNINYTNDFPSVYFICKKENEHISSSDMRAVQSLNRDLENDWNKVLNKIWIA